MSSRSLVWNTKKGVPLFGTLSMTDRLDVTVVSLDHNENFPTRLRTPQTQCFQILSKFPQCLFGQCLQNPKNKTSLILIPLSAASLIVLMLMNNNPVFSMFLPERWMALILQTRTEHLYPLQVGLYPAGESQDWQSQPSLQGISPSVSICLRGK